MSLVFMADHGLICAGEYELLSSSLNHRYYAIHNDRILAREDWEAIGGKRGPGQTVGAETKCRH